MFGMPTMQTDREPCSRFRTLLPSRWHVGLATVGMVLACAGVVRGQQTPKTGAEDRKAETTPPTAKTHPNDPMIWNVDQMMEDAVMQITRRYNLNNAQEEYTRLLLRKRVRAFLDQYETEVRELLQESIEMRLGRRPKDADSLRIWAERAAPLYEAAKNAILEGNEEWGQILDEKQQAIHERDLTLMRANFRSVTGRLDRWRAAGGATPAQTVVRNGAARPDGAKLTDGGAISRPPAIARVAELEDNWTIYVNSFIRAYRLDKKQQNSARERIHRQELARAKKYRIEHRDQFEALKKRAAEQTPKVDAASLLERKRRLERPICEIFKKMARRLDGIPTLEQMKSVDPEQKKELTKLYQQFSGQAAIRPAVKPGKKDVKVKPDKPAAAPEDGEKAGNPAPDAKPGGDAPATAKPEAPKKPESKARPPATTQPTPK
ncbi:MAG: hypothetical protein ACE5E1_10380 [Phycisphaerae bacterium]